MVRYEYRVVPAPTRGQKAKGLKTTEDRFANALSGVMNELGAEGWDYVRADCLPCEERQGLTSSHTVYRSVLVFRRALDDADLVVAEATEDAAPEAETAPSEEETATEADTPETAEAAEVTEPQAEETQPAR